VVVDFRSIVNGTIDGRVEFSVTRGSLHVERLDRATLVLLRGPADLTGSWVPATIDSREVCS
jgi:hypothetical protein